MRKIRALGAALACGLLAASASADVLTFNEFAYEPAAPILSLGSEFSTTGYDFTAVKALVGNPPGEFRVVSRTHPWQADAGFATIVMTDYPTDVIVERSDGTPFDLHSIDLADSANVGVARKVRFTFEYAGGGSAVQDVVLDLAPGLQTVNFVQNNLARLTLRGVEQFVGEFPWYQFDNLSVTAAVPEPGTWAMLAMGLAGLGGAIRRRSASGTPAPRARAARGT